MKGWAKLVFHQNRVSFKQHCSVKNTVISLAFLPKRIIFCFPRRIAD